MQKIFNGTFLGKSVLVTGHTGFKGSWLTLWLLELGAKVIGYSLEPYTKRDNFVLTGLEKKITHIIGDIRDFNKLEKVFNRYNPEIVFHLAAQPIVSESYLYPKETYDINIGGTVNVFECCRNSISVKVIVNVTSDKCYENKEWVWGYRENDPMGGFDPYSSSKGCSELITSAYRNSFFNIEKFQDHGKNIASARAGNVIGGGDWQINRLFPDCMRSIEKSQVINIRNPDAVRPWQHVLEPISGYLLLASKMYSEENKYSGGWNFGPVDTNIHSVIDLVKRTIEIAQKGNYRIDSEDYALHETSTLKLDISKAVNVLGWNPALNFTQTIDFAVKGYNLNDDDDVYQLRKQQILDYLDIAIRTETDNINSISSVI